MEIQIWSDIRCPFCYIGKHHFEKALEQFAHKDEVNVVWRSYELDPHLQTRPDVNALDHLAEQKNISRKEVLQMTNYAKNMGKELGLDLDFEKSVVANSFNAHRLIQFAKTQNLANETEEALFKAHFSEGKNIADKEVLFELGKDLGLDEDKLAEALGSQKYDGAVRDDQAKAASLGISGVPFFVFNNKYGVSGAQPVSVFLETLEKSWSEYDEQKKPLILNKGTGCSIDGSCD